MFILPRRKFLQAKEWDLTNLSGPVYSYATGVSQTHQDVSLSDDGTILSWMESGTGNVRTHPLATPGMLGSIGGALRTNGASDGNSSVQFVWASGGLRSYSTNATYNRMTEREYSTPYNTATLISTQQVSLGGSNFLKYSTVSPDGTKVIAFSAGEQVFYEYDMTTAHDPATLSLVRQRNRSAFSPSGSFYPARFSPSGKRLLVRDGNYGLLRLYALSTAWNINTIGSATLNTVDLSPHFDGGIQGFNLDYTGTRLYAVGKHGNYWNIKQFDL